MGAKLGRPAKKDGGADAALLSKQESVVQAEPAEPVKPEAGGSYRYPRSLKIQFGIALFATIATAVVAVALNAALAEVAAFFVPLVIATLLLVAIEAGKTLYTQRQDRLFKQDLDNLGTENKNMNWEQSADLNKLAAHALMLINKGMSITDARIFFNLHAHQTQGYSDDTLARFSADYQSGLDFRKNHIIKERVSLSMAAIVAIGVEYAILASPAFAGLTMALPVVGAISAAPAIALAIAGGGTYVLYQALYAGYHAWTNRFKAGPEAPIEPPKFAADGDLTTGVGTLPAPGPVQPTSDSRAVVGGEPSQTTTPPPRFGRAAFTNLAGRTSSGDVVGPPAVPTNEPTRPTTPPTPGGDGDQSGDENYPDPAAVLQTVAGTP